MVVILFAPVAEVAYVLGRPLLLTTLLSSLPPTGRCFFLHDMTTRAITTITTTAPPADADAMMISCSFESSGVGVVTGMSHDAVLQSRVSRSLLEAGQGVPPCSGSVVTVNVRRDSPPPQDSLQSFQDPHAPTQSTRSTSHSASHFDARISAQAEGKGQSKNIRSPARSQYPAISLMIGHRLAGIVPVNMLSPM